LISAVLIVLFATSSWYVPSLVQNNIGIPYEIATSVLICGFAGFSLWSNGPNPVMFGLIIGSGWFFLNRFSDLVFPAPSE